MGAGSSEGRKGGRSRSGRKAPGAADSASHLQSDAVSRGQNTQSEAGATLGREAGGSQAAPGGSYFEILGSRPLRTTSTGDRSREASRGGAASASPFTKPISQDS